MLRGSRFWLRLRSPLPARTIVILLPSLSSMERVELKKLRNGAVLVDFKFDFDSLVSQNCSNGKLFCSVEVGDLPLSLVQIFTGTNATFISFSLGKGEWRLPLWGRAPLLSPNSTSVPNGAFLQARFDGDGDSSLEKFAHLRSLVGSSFCAALVEGTAHSLPFLLNKRGFDNRHTWWAQHVAVEGLCTENVAAWSRRFLPCRDLVR